MEEAPGELQPVATVLLLEDEPAVRNLVTRFLTLKGYRVLSADNSDTARALWREHQDQIQLLLADMILPSGMSGCDMGREFQSQNPGLKVLYTSGFNVEGAFADRPGEQIPFIPKPYRPEQLLAAVRGTLASDANIDFRTYGEDSPC